MHHKDIKRIVVKQLKKDFPLLKTQDNTLFTKSKNIYTSAGVVTGIDLALFLIEERHSKQIATQIAKGLVVYNRSCCNCFIYCCVVCQFRSHSKIQWP